MTVDSSSAYEFNISQVVLMAYQAAGLMNEAQATSGLQWSQKLSMAMNFLEMDIKALQAAGIFVRPIDFYDLTVTAGLEVYALPAETLDLIGTAQWLMEDDFSLNVFPVQRETYVRFSNKQTQGQPTMYYTDRQRTLNVCLYPCPDDSGTVRFQRHRLLANARNGQNTLDLERHWTKYLVYELAKCMAFCHSLPTERVKALREEAFVAKELAMGYSKERGPQQFHVGHRTSWSR